MSRDNQHLTPVTAEREIVGGLLMGWGSGYANLCDDVLAMLQPEDFSLRTLGDVFTTVRALRNAGEAVSIITVSSANAEIDFVTIAEMARDVHQTAALISHARLVLSAAQRRRRIAALQEALQLTTEGRDELAEEALGLASTAESRGDVTWTPMVDLVREALNEIDRRMRSGEAIDGVRTGFRELDEVLLGLRSELVVLAARPGLGKTTLALQLIRAAAKSGPVLMFSLEMPGCQLAERALSYASGVSGNKLRRAIGLDSGEFGRLSMAVAELRDEPIFVRDLPGVTAGQVMHAAKSFERQQKRRPAMIVVDYLQLLRVAKAEKRTEAVGDACRTVRLMARTLGVPVLLLSQLNRNVEGSSRRPVNSDLRDSGEIEQEADRILMLHRPEPERPYTELLVTKNRHGATAADGSIALELTGAGFVQIAARPQQPQQQERQITKARTFGKGGIGGGDE